MKNGDMKCKLAILWLTGNLTGDNETIATKLAEDYDLVT